MSETVIRIEHIGKQYRLGQVGTGTISHDLNRWWHKVRGKEDPFLKVGDTNDPTKTGESEYVWSLKDISFDVKKGESVGIIGKNGAGKSTLLKILSQVTTPTTGSVKVKGRIASLLEVGTGFHQELTGRENIFLNGAILGMSKKEITSKLDEIIAFSGVERYIDTPVKRYSSGQRVRLAFAVAAHLDPEILVIDEVLAVGDAEFQNKCIGKMQDVAESGRTILFVSHNMSAVRNLCSRVIVLSEGKSVFDGDVNQGITRYFNLNQKEITNKRSIDLPVINNAPLRISSIIFDSEYETATYDFIADQFKITFLMMADMVIPDTMLVVFLEDSNDNAIFISSTDENELDVLSKYNEGLNKIQILIPGRILKPGKYFLTFSLRSKRDEVFHKVERAASFIVQDNHTYRGMKNRYRSAALISPEIKFILER